MKNIVYTHIKSFLTLFTLLYVPFVFGQLSISGPQTVYIGETHVYNVLGATNITHDNWSVSGNGLANVVSTKTSTNGSKATVAFTKGGTVNVTIVIEYNDGIQDSVSLPVTITTPDPPNNPTIFENGCGQTVLRRTGSPPDGYTWYWQGTSRSTGTIKGSGEYYTADEGSGTYYIRTREDATGHWSSELGSVYVSVSSLDAGSIEREGEMVFCINGNPGNLRNKTSPSGGSGGYTYQWQYSNNGTSGWTNISGATSNSYNPPGGLSTSRWYRRRVTSCSGQNVYSNSLKATVHPPLQGGTINGQDAICYRDNPGILGNVTSPSGGFGSTIYQWEVSLNGSAWTEISGATSLTYDPPGDQTQTKSYRRKVVSCEQTKYSNTVTVTVHPLLGPPTGSGAVSRCGNGTVSLSLTPDADANSLHWYTTETGGSYIHQGTTYTTPNIGGETTYYASSYDTGASCESNVRKAVTITINTLLTWYLDGDGDGHAISQAIDCTGPGSGYTLDELPVDDCDDSDAALNPDTIWYLDSDNDGHAAGQTLSCTSPGAGYTLTVLPLDDCNDTDNTVAGETTWYEDEDGDGFGDPTNYITQCMVPEGYVTNNLDLCPMVYDAVNTCDSSGNGPVTADNYVYTRTYQSERLTAPEFFTENDYLIQQIAYYDGLGRPVQQIGIDQSPSMYDIVTHINYDDYSRQEKEYLPYPTTDADLGTYRPDALSKTNRHYHTPKYQNTVNPFSQKEFEPSPLNRVLKQAAPGEDWKLIKNADDHSIEFAYSTNIQNPDDANDPDNNNVRLFQVDLSTVVENPALAEHGFYSEGELYKNVTKDENHTSAGSATNKLHTTEEFTDKQGRVVLKRTYADVPAMDRNGDGDTDDAGEEARPQAPHDTYYVYDDYGNLTYVLPPKMEASTASLTDINTHLAELGYQYVYDHRNRLVEKRIPGKGAEYIIYNKLDQPIMTQDANQRAKSPNEWLFTKYDGHDRVAYTGIAVETGDYTCEQIQEEVDAFTNPLWVMKVPTEEADATNDYGGTTVYYNDGAYPKTTTIPNDPMVVLGEVLTINYYDNYDFDRSGTGETATALGVASDPRVQGLATGSKVKVLDPSAGSGQADWITTVNYYDEKGRPIYSYTNNGYLGTLDIVETRLDFIGRPTKVRTSHTRNGMTIVTIDNFTYDHTGRLLAQTQCIGDETLGDSCTDVEVLDNLPLSGTITDSQVATNSITVTEATLLPEARLYIDPDAKGTGKSTELIVYNDYDELGQLAHKKVGGTPGGDYSTSQELQEVDYKYNIRGWLTDINDISDAVPNKLFNFSLSYDQSPDPLYNGNISQTQWRTANTDHTLKSYGYTYDGLNRIIGATGAGDMSKFNLSGITYDKNGNLLSLRRLGHKTQMPVLNDMDDSDYGAMDILDYAYHNDHMSNRLYKVRDDGEDAYGFRDGSGDAQDYWYDDNGNMTRDLNKGIGTSNTDGITYNHLNLPMGIAISGGGGDGTIDYIYDATGIKLKKRLSNGNSTEYVGNYVYEGGNLVQFFHPEGYVEPDGSGGYSYIYQYIDHLGNVRLSYSDLNNNGSIDAGSEILQERNYYPFGLEHKGYNNMVQGVESNYKQFQGQEWTEDLGLNIHEWKYRVSDPTIGRFWQIDPLAEDYSYQSPYNFSENRVIDSAELEGLERVFAADGKFIDQAGDSQEIRVLNNKAGDVQGLIGIVNNPDSSPEDVEVAQKTLNSVSHHAFESMDEAAGNFAFNYNVASMEADKEFGAVLNTVTLSNEDGSNIEGTDNNTVVVRGPKVEGTEDKVGTNVLQAAKDAGTPGVLSGLVHTHGNKSNDFSRGGDMGGLLHATDESTSRRYNIPVYMSNKRGQLKVLDVNRGREETLPKRVPR